MFKLEPLSRFSHGVNYLSFIDYIKMIKKQGMQSKIDNFCYLTDFVQCISETVHN